MKLPTFDPVKEFGAGWTIESNVKTSPSFDISQSVLRTYLTGGELYVTGNQVRERQTAAGDTPLSADVAQYFYDNPSKYPESWKGKYVFFDGTILRSPGGRRFTVYAFWNVVAGTVKLDYNWLDIHRNADDPSALLASSEMLGTGARSFELRLKKVETILAHYNLI